MPNCIACKYMHDELPSMEDCPCKCHPNTTGKEEKQERNCIYGCDSDCKICPLKKSSTPQSTNKWEETFEKSSLSDIQSKYGWTGLKKNITDFIKDVEAKAVATTMLHFKNEIIPAEISALLTELEKEVEGLKQITGCQPDKNDPVAQHEFVKDSDWRSECKRCGAERGDTENMEVNSALSQVLELIKLKKRE
jgi:hypothetical protein